ncbi:hypothetical protein SAMN02745166_01044 [Prosthecobacter debontii]|uniref:Uncharacterized protein n=1 Tax=Prosthecobacter debontii TaxID=48467 RepID=A0A1T4X5I4_9BACT|nr:hypothetical protein [Prosthecobacter debontii]SKA84689.1 hypothetical protein SAMN02745166_01044 [Prosthecobacter debontii]
MITVGSLVTPRVPIKAHYSEGPIPGDEPDEFHHSRSITPGERFEVIALGYDIAVIMPIIGGEDLTISCSDLEPWIQ